MSTVVKESSLLVQARDMIMDFVSDASDQDKCRVIMVAEQKSPVLAKYLKRFFGVA